MKLKRYILLFLLISVSLFSSVYAQKPKSASPFNDGENLTYEGKFSKSILRGIAVADLSFTVSSLPNSNDYMVSKHDGEAGTRLTENVDRSSGLWH